MDLREFLLSPYRKRLIYALKIDQLYKEKTGKEINQEKSPAKMDEKKRRNVLTGIFFRK